MRSLRAGTAVEAIVSQRDSGYRSITPQAQGSGDTPSQSESTKRVETLQDTLDFLRCMPEDDSQRLLRELRSAPEVASVLRATTGPFGNFKKPLSKEGNAGSLLPSLDANLELELVALYPIAFPTMERPQKPGLHGATGGIAEVRVQDPSRSDPVTVWELPRDGM
ncbi:hypothetical protein PMIN01_11786 [Paraphaeosphaeria minitans]|uniref:Uncharacterized protein n=1 Tax=Paraphaeosphaeria minitans TaxID=565426 RepID=A0A9P6G7C8_9PLEO|nr:hypothetical protein PMIN01_11786 [Paraphaeosphaeria minitans]